MEFIGSSNQEGIRLAPQNWLPQPGRQRCPHRHRQLLAPLHNMQIQTYHCMHVPATWLSEIIDLRISNCSNSAASRTAARLQRCARSQYQYADISMFVQKSLLLLLRYRKNHELAAFAQSCLRRIVQAPTATQNPKALVEQFKQLSSRLSSCC